MKKRKIILHFLNSIWCPVSRGGLNFNLLEGARVLIDFLKISDHLVLLLSSLKAEHNEIKTCTFNDLYCANNQFTKLKKVLKCFFCCC